MSFLPDKVKKCWTKEEEFEICFESERERNRRRLQAIVCDHHLKQVKEILLYNELATWRRENGFDRVEAVEKNWFGDHRSLPPTPEQYYASLWAEVDELKAAISMPIRGGPSWQGYKRNIIRKIEQDEMSDEDFAVIKRLVETRDRDAAQVTVTQVSTVQHCSPIPKTPEPPPDACFNLENNEGKMGKELEKLESLSADTGLEMLGQQSPPNQGIWEQGRTIANGILTAGVDSSQGGRTPSPPERSTSTRTFADIFSTAAIQENRRHKTTSPQNKQFDPGGRGEKAPPWNAAVPLHFFFLGRSWEASCLFCLCPVCVFVFPKLLIYPGETYQQAERRGSWTPIKSLMYATGGQAFSRLLPYLKMAMTSNARFDCGANALE